MKYATICYCNRRVKYGEVCPCKIAASRMRNKLRDQAKPEEKKFFNSSKWKKLRLKVIKRDNAVCQRCLIKNNVITTDHIQVHHIKPRVKYPELRFTESNLVTLCRSCNTGLGIKEELDFKWEYKDEWEPVL